MGRMGLCLAAWLPMVPIAVANGALRQGWYGRYLSELTAHQVSTLSAAVLLGVYVWLVLRRWPPAGPGSALAIGLAWCALTLGFEFLFGHWVAGRRCCWSGVALQQRLELGHLCGQASDQLRLEAAHARAE